MLHAVIMAGGSGTRFWPASRSATPKQLLNFDGKQTMIQATIGRLGELVPPDRLLVLTNRKLVAAIRDQAPQLPESSVIGEPCKRDTAPCIGLAAAILAKRDPEAVMIVMPADHVIQHEDRFQEAIRYAGTLVERDPGTIVTFGISPTYPAESFGYIERGEPIEASSKTISTKAFQVVQFREKPAQQVARQYLESGEYYWNSGIFLWKAQTILDALQKFEPEMFNHIHRIAQAVDQGNFDEVLACEFEAISGKSIDYAVMERYDNVAVVEAPFDWDDVGSWQSLSRLHDSDSDGNTLLGKTLALRTRNSIVSSDQDHLVATVGLEDVIVVHTPNATLVVHRDEEESVREIVALLQEQGDERFL